MAGFAGLREWHRASPPRLGIVFTDIVESTGLQNARESGDFTAIMRAHRARATALAERLDGLSDFAGRGDGLIALFRSVTGAFAFARGIFEDPGHPVIQVRAGVHFGTVRVESLGGSSSECEPTSRDVTFTHHVMTHRDPGPELWVSDHAKLALEREAGEGAPLRWLASEDCTFAGIPGTQRRWRAG